MKPVSTFIIRRHYFLLSAILLLSFLLHSQKLSAQECSSTIGAPACSGQTDPGSTSAAYLPSPYVANPIDVVSGNKYQRSDDYLAFGSRLQFTRHYNSADGSEPSVLGAGWRHSYDVVLKRASTVRLLLKQSDGRILEFLSDDAAPTTYRAHHDADGYVETGNLNKWNLPDGRVLSFKGSHLVEIAFSDNKQLKLKYKHNRLDSVTDELGRTIQLHYYQGKKTLGSYDKNLDGSSAGQLRALQLPDNSFVKYRYDNLQNLITVDYPEGRQSRYQYTDADFTHHMTGAYEALEDLQKSWKYDHYGRAVQHNNETADLTVDVEYAPSSDQHKERVVKVVTSDGWNASYSWVQSEKLNLPHVKSYEEKPCPDCKITEKLFSEKSIINWSVNEPSNTKKAKNKNAVKKPVSDGLNALETLMFTPSPESLGGDLLVGYNDIRTGNVQRKLQLSVDRVGKIRDLSDGKTSMSQLQVALSKGGAQSCGAANSGQKTNIPATNTCVQTLLTMQRISQRAAQKYRIPPTSNLQNVLLNNRFCAAPAHRNCDLLRNDYRMAQLSSCVYSDNPCGNGYVEVDPRNIGLSKSDFEKGHFKATLYKNQKTGKHVVAFRGTNPNSFSDIGNSVAQGMGKGSKYYDRAKKLSRKLNKLLSNVSYTGHSLGGGLATAAALEIGEKATVFNAASLHPNTVPSKLTEYVMADKHIISYTVDGDILSHIQDGSVPGKANFGSLKNSVTLAKVHGRVFTSPKVMSKPTVSGSYNPAKIRYTYAAPGARFELNPPSDSWINQNSRAPRGIALHTISAVLESMKNKILKQCKTLF